LPPSSRREFRKGYLALVWGWPREDRFAVDAPLRRRGEVEPSPVWVKQIVHPGGRASTTRFEVLERFARETSNGDRFALLRCELLTGRMHQIRVHLAHAGHPVVGDKLYGPDENCYLEFIETGWSERLAETLLLDRQALHAERLAWRHHRWACPLPADFREFLAAP